MRPEDLALLVNVGNPVVSPDGAEVAFVVQRVDADANRYRSAVWVVDALGAKPPRQVTTGDQSDGNPAWSPDGRWLAFTSLRKQDKGKERTTLHLLPWDQPGETVTLADRDEAIGDLAWSPDSTRLAFTSRVRHPRLADDDEGAQPPRKVERLLPRIDSIGWVSDRPQHVFVVPVDGSSPPVQVTRDDVEHQGLDWRPDSAALVVVAGLHPDADLDQRTDLHVFALGPDGLHADGPPARIPTAEDTAFGWPRWSPDGNRIAAVAQHATLAPSQPQAVVVDVGSGAHVELARTLDRSCLPYPGVQAPVWHDGDVLFSVEDRGATHLYRAPADASDEPSRVVGGDRWVLGYDAAAGTVAVVASTMEELPDLFALVGGAAAGGTGEAELRALSTIGAAVHKRLPALPAEHLEVTSPAGDGPIDAWLIRPAGEERGEGDRLPVLVNVHGGPHTQYGHRWFDEFQVYASAGYAVLFCNPHGSTGDTEARMRSIRSPKAAEVPGTGWGGIDFDDVMATVDAALDRFPELDPDRLGIMGGSYGGYMTSWAISHTDRFAAACSERAANNLLTLETASDFGGLFHWQVGVTHVDDPEEYLRRSPVTYAKDISTPVLILHSEGDLRCPVEQADQLFVALRTLGRDVEYHRFPGESHELTRSGSPTHRRQRFEIILDFFGRHLHPAAAVADDDDERGDEEPAS